MIEDSIEERLQEVAKKLRNDPTTGCRIENGTSIVHVRQIPTDEELQKENNDVGKNVIHSQEVLPEIRYQSIVD